MHGPIWRFAVEYPPGYAAPQPPQFVEFRYHPHLVRGGRLMPGRALPKSLPTQWPRDVMWSFTPGRQPHQGWASQDDNDQYHRVIAMAEQQTWLGGAFIIYLGPTGAPIPVMSQLFSNLPHARQAAARRLAHGVLHVRASRMRAARPFMPGPAAASLVALDYVAPGELWLLTALPHQAEAHRAVVAHARTLRWQVAPNDGLWATAVSTVLATVSDPNLQFSAHDQYNALCTWLSSAPHELRDAVMRPHDERDELPGMLAPPLGAQAGVDERANQRHLQVLRDRLVHHSGRHDDRAVSDRRLQADRLAVELANGATNGGGRLPRSASATAYGGLPRSGGAAPRQSAGAFDELLGVQLPRDAHPFRLLTALREAGLRPGQWDILPGWFRGKLSDRGVCERCYWVHPQGVRDCAAAERTRLDERAANRATRQARRRARRQQSPPQPQRQQQQDRQQQRQRQVPQQPRPPYRQPRQPHLNYGGAQPPQPPPPPPQWQPQGHAGFGRGRGGAAQQQGGAQPQPFGAGRGRDSRHAAPRGRGRGRGGRH